MKKILFLSLVAILSVLMTGCSRDNDSNEKPETQVNVKVIKDGVAINGITVYMFDSERPATFKPLFSKKSAITESGVAIFKLQEVFDLNIIDKQTTIYFAVFQDEKLIGRTGVTIEKEQTKTATITLQ